MRHLLDSQIRNKKHPPPRYMLENILNELHLMMTKNAKDKFVWFDNIYYK